MNPLPIAAVTLNPNALATSHSSSHRLIVSISQSTFNAANVGSAGIAGI
jgi:hypothetical protein